MHKRAVVSFVKTTNRRNLENWPDLLKTQARGNDKNIKCVENMTTATSNTACSLELTFGTSPQSAQRAVVCQNHEPGKLA